MRERSLAVGGSVEIETTEGEGTTITLRIPAGGAQK
jgi:signal transduction histidine kinase